MNAPPPPQREFHLIDLAALVVGYSLASVLVRAFWPPDASQSVIVFVVIGMVFLWLGMAMSGPVVLLGRRRRGPAEDDPDRDEPRTWAELAWLVVGFYWIGLAVLVVPVRMRSAAVLDTAFLGLFPIVAAIGLRWFRPYLPARRDGDRSWTHRAAVVLLVTWPLAWVAMILLGKTLP